MRTSRLSFPRAFTLIEVLISMAIAGLAMAGVLTLYTYVMQNDYFSEQKLLINANARNFSETLMESARDSNFAVIYQSFYASTAEPYSTANNVFPYTGNDKTTNWPGSSPAGGDTVTWNAYQDGTTKLNFNDRLVAGQAGDYMVFITYSDPFYGFTPANAQAVAPDPMVSRIVAFWIAPNRLYNGTNGQPAAMAMYSFDSNNFPNGVAPYKNSAGNAVAFPAVLNSQSDLEALLPPNTLAAATDPAYAKIIANDIRGQVGLNSNGATPNQGLNFQFLAANQVPNQNPPSVISTTAVLVNSMILDGNAAKHVTNTYNFTINPNG